MADEVETALAALEERAPLTPEPGDENFQQQPVPAPAEAGAQPPAGTDAEAAKTQGGEVPELEALKKKLADYEKRVTDKDGQAAAERARRRAAEQQAAQFRQQVEQFQRQMAEAQMRQRMGKVPDPEENVVEALKYERMLRLAREREAQAQQAQQAQLNQQMQFVTQLKNTVEDFEAEFREQQPEYDEAANFLVDTEQKRLELAGVPKPQAEQMAINWAVNMASMMVQQGKNPAQVAWEAAAMMGWKPKGAQDQGAAAAAVAAAAAGQPQAVAAGQQKLAAQKAGQDAAKTLGGGGARNTEVDSLSAIVNLKGAAFDSAVEKFLRGG